MFFLRIVLMALRSLRIHPLRTVLATLGVIIGVAAVVSAMSILEGTRSEVEGRFATLGSNKLFVFPGIQRDRGRAVGNVNTLKLDDADEIARACPSVASASPQVTSASLVKFLSKNTQASVLGTSETYADINHYQVAEGRFITRDDIVGEDSVVVLGWRVKRDLFGGRPALGEVIKISGLLGSRGFRVIGVMEKKGNIGWTDVDRQVVVPVTTAMKKLYGLDAVSMILCESKSAENADIEAAKSEIKKLLRQRHRVRPGQQDDFQVQAQGEFLKQFSQMQNIFAVVLYSIAGISLVVGGIGIMNIMLVAVTERTREIGVRMAMGARRADVLRQFLIEAGIVSFLGGGLGVLLGWGMAQMLEQTTRILNTSTTTQAISWALSMATITGLVSGIYPAYKASKLDPVEALRYE
ncbi:MAG: ABC transporter permease [Phycisphaerae bacterium]|nr:ABC transporter permease [Phycisphaerae bacterium]